MNNNSLVANALQQAGLSEEAAAIYIALCKGESTHLSLSRMTGINRTKVYRVVQELEHHGLVSRQTDDRGTFLRACDIGVLELELSAREQQLREQRSLLRTVTPSLHELRLAAMSDMIVRTYEGAEGLKQMCWHELKTQDELLVLGGGAIEDMIPNRYWAEKHRRLSVEACYNVYEIVNHAPTKTFTTNAAFMELYECRVLPAELLTIAQQTTIYNNTVAIYYWQNDHKTGVEIINPAYAAMMRQLFKTYWGQAKPVHHL